MNINAITNVNFRAKVSSEFQQAAKRYYDKQNRPEQYELDFQSKVDEYKLFGNQNMSVEYRTLTQHGQKMHALYITEPGQEPVLLSKKDMFRKLVDKFMNVNEYEFNIKVEQARNEDY